MEKKKRCLWAEGDILEQDYHDKEWGKPLHDEMRLFEMLILEGMQAGLSWHTILKKRKAFKEAFDGFDARKIALYGKQKTDALMKNEGIIRNRLKIEAAVKNAKAYLKLKKESGGLDKFLWNYVGNKPILNGWKSHKQIPAKTELSDQISKDLKKLGFSFVGSTIVYAYMQAIGMVNDHTKGCFCYKEKKK